MIRLIKSVSITFAAILFAGSSAWAQGDAPARRALLQEMADTIDANIFEPARAPAYREALEMLAQDDRALAIADDEAFALAVHRVLQAVLPDGHLGAYGPARTARILGHDMHEETSTDTHHDEASFSLEMMVRSDRPIALVRIADFPSDPDAALGLNAALAALPSDTALIFDLRGNRGGDALYFRILAGCLISHATPVHGIDWRRGGGFETVERVSEPDHACARLFTVPAYVLTDHETASTAELMPFILQARERAIVVGEPTYGASHPAEFFELSGGYGMMVPIGRAFDPVTGADWEGTGVIPDLPVPGDRALEVALSHLEGAMICREMAAVLPPNYDCEPELAQAER